MRTLQKLVRFAGKSRREQFQTARATFLHHLVKRGWVVPHLKNDRTAYIVGLYGSGRHYVNELILFNIGERAKYFREKIRFHPGPTSIIYSGHATIKYLSRAQAAPGETGRILEGVKAGFADLIFLYRHPLDSLLTNWVWWRTYIRENKMIAGISQAYKNMDELAADLEKNFADFRTFADGDPAYFAGMPGPRFLSFTEFVEETELFPQSASVALKLEDFMSNPVKEFSKIVEVMSAHVDMNNVRVWSPKSKPYGYLAVQEKSLRFRDFITGLDAETKSRIQKIGYSLI
jgi:hypothetical protein